MKIDKAVVGMAILMLSSCASARDYVQDYRGHPQARVDCAGGYSAEYESNVSAGTVPRDKRGSNYEACVEKWALRKAASKATNINFCMLLMFPFSPICYLFE